MNKTGISWTDLTWNPVTGCSKVSPGCQNCYAEALYKRYHFDFTPKIHPEKLKQVKSIPAGSKVFVNSTSDLFHEEIPFDFIKLVVDAIRSRPDVIFQVLTKRPERAARYWNSTVFDNEQGFPANLWLGVSVEMALFKHRISTLLFDIPASVKFVSFEPLLGDIGEVRLYESRSPGYRRGVDWIIIGGESGPNHRPFNPDWARNLIRQAKEQNVAVWMKQLGGFRPGGNLEDFPEDMRYQEFPEAKP